VALAYMAGAWLLIQIVETLTPDFLPAVVFRTTVIIAAVGVVPALVLAWKFEWTTKGLQIDRGSETDSQRSDPRLFDKAITVALVLAVAYFAVDKFVLDPSRDASQIQSARQEGRSEALIESYGDTSIAVLPFVNMSSDEDQEFFSDGISEELLNLLARIPQLRVISRRSAFAYRGRNVNVGNVARELNVTHILEGSVRRAGDQVRITVQLIEALSDTHLWSQSYDRKLNDIFAIQDDIAATVVDQLKIELMGDAPTTPVVRAEAYALYLQARHLGRLHTPEAWEQSNQLYDEALAIDPTYAAAWSGKSVNYSNLAGSGQMDAREGAGLAREASQTALSIDPNYAPAYSTLGWVDMAFDGNFALAAGHYEKALALDPASLSIISNTATLLLYISRYDEAIKLREYAMARDPVNAVGHFNLGVTYMVASRLDESIASLESTLRLAPKFNQVHNSLAKAHLLKGDYETALEISQQAPLEHYRLSGQALVYFATGEQEKSDAALAELIDKHAEKRAFVIATVLAYRQEPDRAFEWMERAIENREPSVVDTSHENLLANLHEESRWPTLIESLGQSPAQKAEVLIEVALPN
jgi:TolB-like protein/Tfp pilus assembly protein PilF